MTKTMEATDTAYGANAGIGAILRGFIAAVFVTILSAGAMAMPHTAHADENSTQAEELVREMGDDAIRKLTGNGIAPEQRKTRFRELLNENFDIPTIAKFALGRYWRRATKDERAEYLKLFEDMIVNTYSQRFEEYSGYELRVEGSVMGSNDDIFVRTVVESPDNGNPVSVDWRVRNRDGKMKIIDVIIEQVSMGVTQRSDFSSVIQRGGGDIEALLASMREHNANNG